MYILYSTVVMYMYMYIQYSSHVHVYVTTLTCAYNSQLLFCVSTFTAAINKSLFIMLMIIKQDLTEYKYIYKNYLCIIVHSCIFKYRYCNSI